MQPLGRKRKLFNFKDGHFVDEQNWWEEGIDTGENKRASRQNAKREINKQLVELSLLKVFHGKEH